MLNLVSKSEPFDCMLVQILLSMYLNQYPVDFLRYI